MKKHRDLYFFSNSITRLPNGEWECRFRGIDIIGYAPTMFDASLRNFTRIEDNRKPAQSPAPIQPNLWERAA